MNKLMLGGGHLTKGLQAEGWFVIDGSPEAGADATAVLPPLPDVVMSQQWGEICAIHFIEHLYYEDAKALIRQTYEILEPGGRLVLEQANLEWIARAILGQVAIPTTKYAWMSGDTRWFMEWSLYPQPHMINGNGLQHHRYGYTPDTLTDLVVQCGFTRERIGIGRGLTHVPERDFRLEAIK